MSTFPVPQTPRLSFTPAPRSFFELQQNQKEKENYQM